MFKKNFKEFDFRGFVDFIFELVDKYGLEKIRFSPEHKENFSEVQLTHIAPGRSINNPDGFVWAWKRCQNITRRIYFDLFSKDGRRKITMTIDLNDKFISLDKEEGISSIEVEDILISNIRDLSRESNLNSKSGLFPGVFIAARKIINNGEISADGPGYRTEIITEDHQGEGKISAKDNKLEEKGLKVSWEQGWFQIIILISAIATIVVAVSIFWR